MADRAQSLMTIAEFLAWDDGTDTRYELIDGRPVAMAQASGPHARISLNIAGIIERAMEGARPCRALVAGGLRVTDGPFANAWSPDVMMTCEPVDDRHLFEAPRLIVEVLSPTTQGFDRTTQGFDRTTKLAYHGRLPSVEEIWLVGSVRRSVLVYHREQDDWRAGLPLIGQAAFASRVLDRAVTLDEIYALTPLAAG